MGRRNRREFLKASAAAGVGFWAAAGLQAADEPRRPAANERLNVAIIGAGGQGGGNLGQIANLKENIVALCDVDERQAAKAFNRHEKAAKYHDFRVMLDKQKDIDAVVVSTPDHQHAVAAAAAIQRGKHVYCEKPMTHDVWEARQLRLLAAKHKVATQMGNQGTSSGTLRTAVEIVQSGALGEVRVAHIWTNRPIWPQNIAQRPKGQDVPQGLFWDLWLGTAPERAYNRAYLPFNWRGWWDFGTGAIGDMACHTMNLAYWALKLDNPTSVVADVATKVNNETAPEGCTITYEFPARKLANGTNLPACRMLWYERRLPPMELFMGQKPSNSGCLIVGSKGTLYSPSDYGDRYVLLPEATFKGYEPPKQTLPRASGHHADWVRACKGGPAAGSNFDYAGPLTEMALLGNVAIRAGQRVTWEADMMRVTPASAQQYVRREYRKGWTL